MGPAPLFVSSCISCSGRSRRRRRDSWFRFSFLSIGAAFGLASAGSWLRGAGLRPLAAAATIGLPLVALGVNGYGFLDPWWKSVAEFFLEKKGPITADRPSSMFEVINRETPASAKLMFLNTNFGFWCDREYLADSAFEASQMNELIRSAAPKRGMGSLLGRLVSHTFSTRMCRLEDPVSPYLF